MFNSSFHTHTHTHTHTANAIVKAFLVFVVLFSFSNNLSAQWSLTGNVIDTNKFIGSLNNYSLRFRVNNLESWYMDIEGRLVGHRPGIIGTHAPTQKICLWDGDSVYVNFATSNMSKGTSSYNGFLVGSYHGNGEIRQVQNKKLSLFTNDIKRLTILGSGEVGIGTNTPTAIFDVNGSIRFRSGAQNGYVLKSDASGNATWQMLNQTDTSATNEIQTIDISNDTIFLTSGGYVVIPDKSDTNELQHLEINGNILSLSNDNTATTVDLSSFSSSVWHEGTNKVYYNNGRVGIGTANPNYNLHMHGVQTSANKNAGNGTTVVANANYHQITNPATGATATDGLLIGNFVTRAIINQQENDNLDIYTNAKKRLTITNSGKVGIGLETPQASLHVHTITPPSNPNNGGNGNNGNNGSGIGFVSKGTSQEHNYSVIQITNNNTGTQQADGLQVGLVNNAAFLKQQENAPLDFYTNNKKRLRITKDGNVGIGNSTPGRKLVVSSDNSSVQLKIQRTGSSAGETEIGTDNKGFYIYTGGYSNNKPFFINTSGEVGIGTTTPSEKLTVNGNIKIGLNNLYFKNAHHGIAYRSSFAGESIGGPVVFGYSGGALGSHTSSETIALRWDNKGNVGIGTTTIDPAYKLVVKGAAHFCRTVVKHDGWCDYVFDKDYKLAKLQDLEKFINQNKHLPEIPTEAEITENGIDLGDMNAKLLKKIEELTLYIIEQDKRINAQNERLTKLEKK